MSNTEAMRAALESMRNAARVLSDLPSTNKLGTAIRNDLNEKADALSAALSQPAQGERYDEEHFERLEALGWQAHDCKVCGESMAAYARPMQGEQREAVATILVDSSGYVVDVVRKQIPLSAGFHDVYTAKRALQIGDYTVSKQSSGKVLMRHFSGEAAQFKENELSQCLGDFFGKKF